MLKASAPRIKRTAEQCVRCGCNASDHADNVGACKRCNPNSLDRNSYRTCGRFCTSENYEAILYFEFHHWAKKWMKAHKNRTIEQLRHYWNSVGQEASYCTSCPKCKTATIAYNTNIKSIVKIQDGLACSSCRHCVDCCECVPCDRCHRKAKKDMICNRCNTCLENKCCHCRICRNCGKECGDDYCYDGTGGGCGYCNACCTCGDNCRVPFYTSYARKIKFYTPTLRDHALNPTSRFIAAEIEVAGIESYGKKIYSKVKEWDAAVVRDGSLPPGGFEINTAPAGGDLFVKQVNDFCKVIKEQQGFVNSRCGLHVHIDARDFKYYDLRRLIRIYAVIEDVLFAMVNPKRKSSKYCVPCGHKYIAAIEEGRLPYDKVKKDVITSVYHARTTQDSKHSKYNNARYNALNIHSWFYRGTIECRMFDGTIDPEMISKWGILFALLLDWVVDNTDEETTRLINTHNSFGVLAATIAKDKSIEAFVRKLIIHWGNEEIKGEIERYDKQMAVDKGDVSG